MISLSIRAFLFYHSSVSKNDNCDTIECFLRFQKWDGPEILARRLSRRPALRGPRKRPEETLQRRLAQVEFGLSPHRMYHSVGTPSFFHMLGASESPLRQGFRAVAPKPLYGAYRAAPLCGDPGKGRKKRYSVALPRLNSAFLPTECTILWGPRLFSTCSGRVNRPCAKGFGPLPRNPCTALIAPPRFAGTPEKAERDVTASPCPG